MDNGTGNMKLEEYPPVDNGTIYLKIKEELSRFYLSMPLELP